MVRAARRAVASPSAGLCVIIFLALALFAIGSIVIPATDWVAQIPTKIPKVRQALEPVIDLYKNLDRWIDRATSQIAIAPAQPATRTVSIEQPNSVSSLLISSAPHLLIQLFFALLVIFFFLAGWTAMRKKTIVSRGSFEGALTTARVIQEVVDATSTYLGTITLINIGLGDADGRRAVVLGMPSPIMWGGIVAVANYIPYLGPIVCALLLFVGGLMTYPDMWGALLPPAAFICFHLVEANFFTPMVVGHRLTISPLSILVSLSFWAWVWGTTGALAGGAAADHHEDHFLGRRHARHRRFPVRARDLDPCRRARTRRRSRNARKWSRRWLTLPRPSPRSPPTPKTRV